MKTVSFQNDILPMKDLLFRLALRITLNRQDAEDVVQETMIRCWNKRDSWQDIDSIQAYATTICRNLALDCTKRMGRKSKDIADTDNSTMQQSTDDNSDNPLRKMIDSDRMKQLESLINQLPEKQKICLQLRDFEEKSYKEIAEMLQITEQQVKTNIFRARQTIKQRFIE
ncbi:MAG: RNA polymerase sigma factor [Bacteroidaceae bacterium]|nr:RNA polymerase sigma factor [Bacteroidaceae bacterium]